MEMPTIHLEVSGFSARDSGDTPCPWRVHAEKESDTSWRVGVLVAGARVADVTVHSPSEAGLTDEVQAIASALVWSAIRSWAMRPGVELGAAGLRDPDAPCSAYDPDPMSTALRDCDSDGHYLCRQCKRFAGKVVR